MKFRKKCKDVGYWRKLGTQIMVTRGKRSESANGAVPKGKLIPIRTARGQYRWERTRYLSALGLSASHRKTVWAGKELRRMHRLMQRAQVTEQRQVRLGEGQP